MDVTCTWALREDSEKGSRDAENEEEEVKHILKMWETLHRMFLALHVLEVL